MCTMKGLRLIICKKEYTYHLVKLKSYQMKNTKQDTFIYLMKHIMNNVCL